jgi:hypothetical protein
VFWQAKNGAASTLYVKYYGRSAKDQQCEGEWGDVYKRVKAPMPAAVCADCGIRPEMI